MPDHNWFSTLIAAVMILYALRCSQDHHFEAWFRNSDTFDKQAAAGIVACPVCGDNGIVKAPMAPRIGKHREASAVRRAETAAVEPQAQTIPAVQGGLPVPTPHGPGVPASPLTSPEATALREVLTAIREEVEKRCDYVGERFAEEARRIHYKEAEARPIYGEATVDEAEALADEGVTFHRIPWLPRTES